jgi:hypothetical protein
MTRVPAALLLASLLAFAVANRGLVVAQGPDEQPLHQIARQYLAARKGLDPGTLRIVHRARALDPATGRPRRVLKALDVTTGRTYGVVIDGQTPLYTVDRVPAWLRASALAQRPRIEPGLARSSGPAAGGTVPALVWLKERRPAPRRGKVREARGAIELEDVRRLAGQAAEERAGTVAPAVEPVLARMAAVAHSVRPYRFVPALAVELSPNALQQVAAWPEVDRIYPDLVAEPELDVARSALKATIVNNRGLSGTSVRLAMVEVGGRIAGHPDLEVTRDETGVCPTASEHSTGVAGLINSLHQTFRGLAPGALLWAGGSCSGFSSELQNRATAAADWGARAINLSWGTTGGLVPGGNDRFFDDMALNRRILVVKSAGNRGILDGRLTSPGAGFNVLTVGGYDDRNTIDWTDDVMDTWSSYVDPLSLHGDREKPEVAAPDMNVVSTTPDGGVGDIGSGTSWSSAFVTGIAALVMQRAPALQVWPEAVKAILMATAIHNIEGDRTLSERDGVGGVAADRADDVVRRTRGGWNGVPYECSEESPAAPIDIPMTLVAGRRTRAVIAWATDPSYDLYESQPGADLDLAVMDPLGAAVTASASLDNTYEIVDFVPASSGQYTLRVTAARCDASPRYLGWAWWRAG